MARQKKAQPLDEDQAERTNEIIRNGEMAAEFMAHPFFAVMKEGLLEKINDEMSRLSSGSVSRFKELAIQREFVTEMVHFVGNARTAGKRESEKLAGNKKKSKLA